MTCPLKVLKSFWQAQWSIFVLTLVSIFRRVPFQNIQFCCLARYEIKSGGSIFSVTDCERVSFNAKDSLCAVCVNPHRRFGRINRRYACSTD